MPKAEDWNEVEMRVNTVYDLFIDCIGVPNTVDYQWFFIVFAPMDNPYKLDPDWFRYKGLDKCRQKLVNHKQYVCTLETSDCAKVHVNALVYGPSKLFELNNKKCYHKYHMYVAIVENTIDDRTRVLNYITKETLLRRFKLYRDYIYSLS